MRPPSHAFPPGDDVEAGGSRVRRSGDRSRPRHARLAANARAAEPDARTTRSPSGSVSGAAMGAIERRRSRRRAPRPAAGARLRRPAKRTRPGGRGTRQEPSCEETAGTSRRSPAHAASRPCPGRRQRPSAARLGRAGELARRRSGSYDRPSRTPDSTGPSPSGSIAISGHRRPRDRPEPRGEWAGLLTAARVTTTFTRRTSGEQLAAERVRVVAAPPLDPACRPRRRPARSASRRRGTPRPARGSRRRCAATQARSAATRRRVSASSAAATSASSPARTWSASAPWPASGSSSSGSNRRPISRAEPEPVEPARREDDRVEPPLAALAQPGVDVAAERLDRERRLEREQLRPPAHRRRPDPHPGPNPVGAAERVPRILARRVGADRRARRCPSRSCPSPSGRRRRSGRRAAPPRAP